MTKKKPGKRELFAMRELRHAVSLSLLDSNLSSAKDDIAFSEWASWHGPASTMWFWGNNNESLKICNRCQLHGWSAARDSAAIITSIINSNSRAAVAIDSYMVKLVMTFYYLLLPLSDVVADVEVVFSIHARTPQSWDGLTPVLVIVSIDFVLVWVITVLYVYRVRYSRQGNSWHAVSQLLAEETRAVLEQSSELKDEQVVRLTKGNYPPTMIGRSEDTGKVHVLFAKD